MHRNALAALAAVLLTAAPSTAEIQGVYLEARTCQVYTGPCFANGEIGLAGQDALMAWSIESGSREGVDLSGLNVVLVVSGSKTLAFQGLKDPDSLRAVVLVDERASGEQRAALEQWAREQAGPAGDSVVRVATAPIAMSLDTANLEGYLQAGEEATLKTRKARLTDCICSNESAYYPPLAKLENFAAGVTLEGGFQGRGLGSRWSMPNSRSAYMGTFRGE